MKVLITGANGFLGQHLTLYLSAQASYTVVATGRGVCKIPATEKFVYYDLELTNKNAVASLLTSVLPNIIIHTAAMSKPDECNNDKEKCLLNNVTATEYLVNAANSIGAKVIYTSTDFVFGENGPHSEMDNVGPLNFYGESKLLAEQLVQNKANGFAIMRPVFIYGKVWQGLRLSFLHWVKENLEEGKQIKVVSDQFRTPTFVLDLCKGIKAMIEANVTGIYHLAGKDIISPYEMAIKVADVLSLNSLLIENVTSETFIEPVIRAKKSGLKINKAIAELNYQPVSFEEGVRLTFG